jgi:hypothetical protein
VLEDLVMRKLVVGVFGCALAACSQETVLQPAPGAPASEEVFVSELALAPLMPESRELTGVATTRDGLYVLDRHHGLFEVLSDRVVPVFTLAELPSRFGLPATLTFTDVVALDEQRFALTAENDGYLFDRSANTLVSHFCYFPPLEEAPDTGEPVFLENSSVSQVLTAQGIPARQLTESVAFSPESGMLFAQPRTFRMDTGEVAGAEVLTFPSSGGGAPEQVFPILNPNFVAGGMVTDGGVRLILGAGNALYTMETNAQPALLRSFEADLRITGMARVASSLVVLLDDVGKRLLWIDPTAL